MAQRDDQFLEDLQALIVDLQAFLKRAVDDSAESSSGSWRRSPTDSRGLVEALSRRLRDFQDGLRRSVGGTARAADTTIRENAWRTLAIGTGAAFCLGFGLAFRRRRSSRGGHCRRLHRGGAADDLMPR